MWPFKSESASESQMLKRITDLEEECTSLRKERLTLKQEVEDLKLKKKIEEEDIKHMMKIKDESLELEYQRKELKLQQEKNDAVAAVKDEYRDKTEAQLNKRGDELIAMYSEILQRLPNVNMEITQKRNR